MAVRIRPTLLALSLAVPTLAAAGEPPPPATVGMRDGEAEAMKPVPASKVTFKPGGGFRVSSDNGHYSMALGARLQFMYTLTSTPGDTKADPTHSFQLRRARVMLGGTLFDGKTRYYVELGFAPRDMGLVGNTVTRSPLFDGWMASEHLRDLSVKAGQMKVPFSHEFLISAGSLQAVDLSLATNEFALDRDLGAVLYSNDVAGKDVFRWFAGVYSGEGHSTYTATHGGFVAVGRVEVFPMGMWADYDTQSDHAREKKAHLGLGGAFAYQKGAHHERGETGSVYADGGTADMQHATADAVFDVAGFSLEGSFFWRHGIRHPGTNVDGSGEPVFAVPVRNSLGFTAQAGYLVPKIPLEVAGQFSQVRPLGADSAIASPTSQATAVVSYYFLRHAYKLQADYSRLWSKNDIGGGSDILRVQLQLTL